MNFVVKGQFYKRIMGKLPFHHFMVISYNSFCKIPWQKSLGATGQCYSQICIKGLHCIIMSLFFLLNRLKCPYMKSFTLSDGEYYEMVKSNFERADRMKVVRTTTNYCTSLVSLLSCYNDLLFN